MKERNFNKERNKIKKKNKTKEEFNGNGLILETFVEIKK